MVSWSNMGWGGALGSCALTSTSEQSRLSTGSSRPVVWGARTSLCTQDTKGRAALLFFSLTLLWNANNSLMLVPGDCVVSLLSSGDLSTFLRGGHIHELRNICLETHWYFNTFFLLQGCPKQTGHFYGLNDLPIENPLIASPFVSQE